MELDEIDFEKTKIASVFTCSRCYTHKIEEVIPNATLRTSVMAIYTDGDLDYGDQSSEDGDTPYYQCEKCGKVIADSIEELKEKFGLKEK